MKSYFMVYLFVFCASLAFGQPEEHPQVRIEAALQKSFANQTSFLPTLIESLEKEELGEWRSYWIAYAHYQNAIFELNQDNEAGAKAAVSAAMEVLEPIKDPNAEELTLQSSLASLSITFAPLKAPFLSGRAGKMINKALKKDEQNLRAWLADGRADFYKPKMYGGGKKVENSLKKALQCPDKSNTSQLAPSWGREEVYSYLIQYLDREDRKDEARLYAKQALSKFPEDYQIQELANHLKP